MRQIRRYRNRKLYDSKESRYITLAQLAEVVRSGESIEVLEYASKGIDGNTGQARVEGEDITAQTLAQIVFAMMGSRLSVRGLADVIRRGDKAFSVERFKDSDSPQENAPSVPSRSAFSR